MSQEIGIMSRYADSERSFRCTTRANFREENSGAIAREKVPTTFMTEHNGTIALSKLSGCSNSNHHAVRTLIAPN
jgi:hypothetical protein